MSKRIAIAEVMHETNTYDPIQTRLEKFNIVRGEAILSCYAGTGTYLGGMLDGISRTDWTALPILSADAPPSGVIEKETLDRIRDELCERLADALPIDGVGLALHGAAVASGVDDVDDALCTAVREVVGPDVPIIATLDLHANISDEMVEHVDVMLPVHEYPHVDMADRGREAMEILGKILSGELRPAIALERVPMLISDKSGTSVHPMSTVNERCLQFETDSRIIDCTVLHGFPAADIPLVGAAVVATANADVALARDAASNVAGLLWDLREELRPDALDPEQAIEQALGTLDGPVVVNDFADNPGSGAPGDETFVLEALLAASPDRSCFGFLYDPEVAAHAHSSGAQETIEVQLGGKQPASRSKPLRVRAYVKCLTDGRFTYTGPMFRGWEEDLGPTVRLQIDGVDVLVASARKQTLDPEVFLLHGIDVTRCRIVVLKSMFHFQAAFQPIAKRIIAADSPAIGTAQMSRLPRKRAPGPMWPLDEDAVYPRR